jgi:hypothetical protein
LNRYSFDLGRQEHIDSLLSTCKLYGSVQCKKAEKSGRRNMISIQPANIRQAWYAALLLSMLGLASSVSFAVEAADAPESTDAVKSEECLKFEADVDADLGEVLKAGCKPTLAQAYKGVYTGIAQFPKKLNDDWNLINRVIWTVPSMPLDQDKIDDFEPSPDQLGNDQGGGLTGQDQGDFPKPIDLFDGRTTGLGDSYYVGLFSPSDPVDIDGGGKFVWGAGFDLGLPTAEEDILGTGKYLAGPSALGVYLGETWKVGSLLMHYWDFEGDDDREDVNMTNLQYFVFYSVDETSSIGAAPNIICNWEASYSKTVQMGKVPVRFGLEFHYYVAKPDDDVSPRWNTRFYIIPAAPSALFDWMG